jgi:alcohol dehydrogenase
VLISDAGVVGAGLADIAMASLKKNGFVVDLFRDLTGEASAKPIETAADLIRAIKPSAVIGLGGGSALDVTKLATVLASGQRGRSS